MLSNLTLRRIDITIATIGLSIGGATMKNGLYSEQALVYATGSVIVFVGWLFAGRAFQNYQQERKEK